MAYGEGGSSPLKKFSQFAPMCVCEPVRGAYTFTVLSRRLQLRHFSLSQLRSPIECACSQTKPHPTPP